MNIRFSVIRICFVLSALCLIFVAPSLAAEYDGIWFLGFNVKMAPFNNVQVRQAVAHCLDKYYIVNEIVSGEVVPAGFIPPGMTGYIPGLKPYKYNSNYAKKIMQKAKYPMNDPRLKNLTLLHTDGVKTIAIAQLIQKNLKRIGMKVDLEQVSYRDETGWSSKLASGKYPLFLMGYKAGGEYIFSSEAGAQVADSYRLLAPLFRSGNEVNFFNYSNSALDTLLDQVSVIGVSFSTERETRLKEVNKILYKELPAVVLFYIEKL